MEIVLRKSDIIMKHNQMLFIDTSTYSQDNLNLFEQDVKEREVIEVQSSILFDNVLIENGRYNLYHAVLDLEEFFTVVDREFDMTYDQREKYNRARLTFEKVFKYK